MACRSDLLAVFADCSSTSLVSIEDPFGDVLTLPPVAFSFFLVTERDAPDFAAGDFIRPQATMLIVARPGIAYRNNATGVDMVPGDGPSDGST